MSSLLFYPMLPQKLFWDAGIFCGETMTRRKTLPKRSDANGDPPRRVLQKRQKQVVAGETKKKRKSAPRKATAAKARPGSVCIREIRRYQLSTDLLIPRTTFHKVVKQIHAELFPSGSGPSSFRYTHTSVEAMQTACEDYLVTLFEDSLLCTLHRNKHTMMPKDMELARKIRREL